MVLTMHVGGVKGRALRRDPNAPLSVPRRPAMNRAAGATTTMQKTIEQCELESDAAE
jgi:hypothetical protein